MKVFLDFEYTFMGNQLLLEEAINNRSLFNFQWLKDFINNKFNNSLKSVPYNGQILRILVKEIENNNEIFFLVTPELETYAKSVIEKLRKDLQSELLTVLCDENFHNLIKTASEDEDYHFIGSSIFDYHYFSNATHISFSTDIFSYIILYIIFFNRVKYCMNNYLHGFLAIMFNYRYLFLPLLIFWPVCFGFSINKFYIMPLFKSIMFSLSAFSVLAELNQMDEERFMLQNYDMEPLCSTGFLTQRYSLRFGILYFLITIILAVKEIFVAPLAGILGCITGLLHYYIYFKNDILQFFIIRIFFIIINILCMQLY